MVFLCLKCHIPLCCGKSVGGTVSFWSDTTEFTQLTEILPSYPQLPNCTAIVSNWTTPVGPTHQGAFTHCSGGQQRPLYSFPFYMAPVHLGHGRMLMFMFSHSHAQPQHTGFTMKQCWGRGNKILLDGKTWYFAQETEMSLCRMNPCTSHVLIHLCDFIMCCV